VLSSIKAEGSTSPRRLRDKKLSNRIPGMRSHFQTLYHGLGYFGQTVILYKAEYSNILSGSLALTLSLFLKTTMKNIEALW
jgi:hypothetical protein